MNLKSQNVQKYWGSEPIKIDYSKIDKSILKPFHDSHPKVIQEWLPKEKELYSPDINYKLTNKQKKHKLMGSHSWITLGCES